MMANDDDKVSDADGEQALKSRFQKRLVRDRHKTLGGELSQRTESRSGACGQNNGLVDGGHEASLRATASAVSNVWL